MTKIIPALLTDRPEDLERMIRACEQFTDFVQIDIMDSKFVPSKSITASDLARIKTNLFLEAHLMVKNPDSCIRDFKNAGAKKIIFHFEATENPVKTIQKIKEEGLEAGLAINPETKASNISALMSEVDTVLFLSVNPGFYGSKFIPEVLVKIKDFKKLHPSKKIGIDGGIKLDNIQQVASLGIDYICVGSAILATDNPQSSFLLFKEAVHK